jgi:hypothetical protein
MSKRRGPQEKKRDSYARDRRNTYGQNDKASRRLIPAKKKLGERAHRKAVHQALRLSWTSTEPAAFDDIDRLIAATKVKLKQRFKKSPDAPLEVVLTRRPRGGVPHARQDRRRSRQRSADQMFPPARRLISANGSLPKSS